MEEPDYDELTWMACQGMEDEEGFPDDPDLFDVVEEAPHENVQQQSCTDAGSRKRTSPDVARTSLLKDAIHGGKRSRSYQQNEVASKPMEPSSLLTFGSGKIQSESALHNRTAERQTAKTAAQCAVFRLANSIEGDYVPITAPSGNRVYAQRKQKSDLDATLHDKKHFTSMFESEGLLSQSIETMLEVAQHERLQKMFGDDPSPGNPVEGSVQQGGYLHEKLWVEKYAPKSFTELLSDEQTNREVLRWLKRWDPTVFGHSDNIPTSKDVLAALRRKSVSKDSRYANKFFKEDWFGSKKNSTDDAVQSSTKSITPTSSFSENSGKTSVSEDLDQKVLLLCGPPGLGKTTLAHIVASHCGYRVVEINASDDRVASTLQGKILDAVQMRSVGDSRPNCLIIDEIDGAIGGTEGRSALKHLIDIVSCKKKTTGNREKSLEDGVADKTRKKTSASALSRPIICICNDLYAPALRPLRQVARVHAFSKPSTSRIVSRLKHICEEESYRASVRALSTLAEHTECDIRACLNTLQFLKRRGKDLNVGDEFRRIGYKDLTTNIFQIWTEIFHHRKDSPSRALTQQGQTASGGGSQELLKFTRLYDLLGNHGDHELAIEGLHENLMHIRYQDSNLSKTVGSLEAICDSDIRSKRVMSKQQFFLNAYQPATSITLRHLVAGPTKPQLEWPKAFQRYRTELSLRNEIMGSWINGMSTTISRSVSQSLLSLEMLSPLLAILSPPLRPVAAQLYTAAEQETMKRLVDTMIHYGLTYKEGKSSSFEVDAFGSKNQEQGEIQLDPPVSTLVTFEGYKVPHRQLSTTIRHLLGHKVQQEKLLREAVSVVKSSDDLVEGHPIHDLKERGADKSATLLGPNELIKSQQPVTANQKTSDGRETFLGVGTSTNSAETSPSSLKVKALPKVTQQISFFERLKNGGQSAKQNQAQSNATNQRDLRPLLYKFHEGFTNAIRRPLLIRELL